MFTKLGKLLINYFTKPVTNSYQPIPGFNTGSITNAIFSAKSVGGNTFYVSPHVNSDSMSFITSTLTDSSSAGVVFGSGTTAPTENDYMIENQITGLTATMSESIVYDSENYRYLKRFEYTVSNNSGASVTISEIGRVNQCYTTATKGSSATSNAKAFLIDRTVLDAPVTIPNGEAGVIRYEFVFPADAT